MESSLPTLRPNKNWCQAHNQSCGVDLKYFAAFVLKLLKQFCRAAVAKLLRLVDHLLILEKIDGPPPKNCAEGGSGRAGVVNSMGKYTKISGTLVIFLNNI